MKRPMDSESAKHCEDMIHFPAGQSMSADVECIEFTVFAVDDRSVAMCSAAAIVDSESAALIKRESGTMFHG